MKSQHGVLLGKLCWTIRSKAIGGAALSRSYDWAPSRLRYQVDLPPNSARYVVNDPIIYFTTAANAHLVYMYLVNRQRDKKYGEPNRESSKAAGMRDQTEFENKDFRYVL